MVFFAILFAVICSRRHPFNLFFSNVSEFRPPATTTASTSPSPGSTTHTRGLIPSGPSLRLTLGPLSHMRTARGFIYFVKDLVHSTVAREGKVSKNASKFAGRRETEHQIYLLFQINCHIFCVIGKILLMSVPDTFLGFWIPWTCGSRFTAGFPMPSS